MGVAATDAKQSSAKISGDLTTHPRSKGSREDTTIKAGVLVSTHYNQSSLQVVVDSDLGHERGADISQIEVLGGGAERRPARRDLATDLVRRVRVRVLEVEDVEPDPGVGREHRVLAGDDRHAERQRAALARAHLVEVGGERAVGRVDVPDRVEAGLLRRALDGRDQLLAVLAEEHVRGRVRGPRGRRGHLELVREQAERVVDRDGPELPVDLVAVHAVHAAAVEHAEAAAVLVERERDRELALGGDDVANRREVRRLVRVDAEQRDGVRAGLARLRVQQ